MGDSRHDIFRARRRRFPPKQRGDVLGELGARGAPALGASVRDEAIDEIEQPSPSSTGKPNTSSDSFTGSARANAATKSIRVLPSSVCTSPSTWRRTIGASLSTASRDR